MEFSGGKILSLLTKSKKRYSHLMMMTTHRLFPIGTPPGRPKQTYSVSFYVLAIAFHKKGHHQPQRFLAFWQGSLKEFYNYRLWETAHYPFAPKNKGSQTFMRWAQKEVF